MSRGSMRMKLWHRCHLDAAGDFRKPSFSLEKRIRVDFLDPAFEMGAIGGSSSSTSKQKKSKEAEEEAEEEEAVSESEESVASDSSGNSGSSEDWSSEGFSDDEYWPDTKGPGTRYAARAKKGRGKVPNLD